MTRKITATITMFLEMDDGSTPTNDDMQMVIHNTDTAIRNRLFGDGFLQSEIMVEEYSVEITL